MLNIHYKNGLTDTVTRDEYDAYLSKYMINNCRTAEYLIKKRLP